MTKADSVAAANVENDSARAASAASPSDAATARLQAAQDALNAANALPADGSAPAPATSPPYLSPASDQIRDLNVMDVDKADVDAHAAALVAATEIHNVALELNHAIVGNQPQAARSLRARYDELLARLEGK